MYELIIERSFRAGHALTIKGEIEESHDHEWRVIAEIAGEKLDSDGILLDFHELERILDTILAPYHQSDLNRTAPFDEISPTAEHVARHIAEALDSRLAAAAEGVIVKSVAVTEAPKCVAKYRMKPQ